VAHSLVPPAATPGALAGALQPEALVADLEHAGLALLACPSELAAPISHALQLGPELLRSCGLPRAAQRLHAAAEAQGLALAYKQQGRLKERLQVRRLARSSQTMAEPPPGGARSSMALPETGPEEGEAREAEEAGEARAAVVALEAALVAFEKLALAAFGAWCRVWGVPGEEALRRFGDPGHGPGEPLGGKHKSVLNLYHYFNDGGCEEEPCREHADPGLVTILCRSTNAGLQVRLPRCPGGAPGHAAEYEEAWLDVEPAMDDCAHEGGPVLLAAVGETLERLSGCRVPSCRHRVAKTVGPRFNAAYELRPRTNVWHAWPALAGPGLGVSPGAAVLEAPEGRGAGA